jgi:PAS domain S-box-containing protein
MSAPPVTGVADASLAAILSIAADAIVTVDEGYRIVQFNRGAEESFGYRADEVLGRPLEVLIPERFRRAHRGHVTDFAAAAHAARRMGERREIWALAKGGREFPAEASISKIDAPGGRLYTVVLRDVTARHRAAAAERLLAAAGAALAQSLDLGDTARAAAAAGVPALADAAVAVLAAGPGAPASTAASPHDDADVASLLAALAAEAAGGGALWCGVAPPVGAATAPESAGAVGVAADDAPAWIARHAATPVVRALALALRPRGLLVEPSRAPGGAGGAELTWFVLADRAPPDDADLALAASLAGRVVLAATAARLYGDARRAVRARDEVLAVVSHDLRNPLSTVAMCAAALDRAADAGVREVAGTVRQAVQWMQAIIDDLLEAARLESGPTALERAPVDAGALVARAAALHATAAEAAGVALVARAASALPPLMADARRLMRALGNLVDNAVKFTPAGGQVLVRAEAGPEGSTHLVVADTGPGIAPEHLPHLFERFWQARAQRRGGAGLGLAIAKGIAEAHGGRLDVASAVGVGTTFTLVLPPGPAAATPHAVPSPHAAQSGGRAHAARERREKVRGGPD